MIGSLRRLPPRGSVPARAAASGITVGLIVGIGVSFLAVLAPAPVMAATSSAVTVAARDIDPDYANAPFPDLAVTVSQTRDLTSQGILVSWTGGKASTPPTSGTGGSDFVQIAQCWGDDPEDASRPDRTTCQYGGLIAAGAARDNFVDTASVAPEDLVYTALGSGFANPTYTSIPFRPSDGEIVASVVDGKKVDVNVNTNQYFTQYTTNEVKWAGSGGDGSGSARFTLQTAMESPALGCGAPVDTGAAVLAGKSCWLVVIPRGDTELGEASITKSGLFWNAWKHSVAIKLGFKAVGLRCTIGVAERQISGSELAAGAIASWQPKLCAGESGATFTLSTGSDSDAVEAALGTSPSALALTSRPAAAESPDPLAYAPVALTGVSVGFAIDRRLSSAATIPAEFARSDKIPFDHLNLTPRLIAKLLTYSYLDSVPTRADRSHLGYLSSAEPGDNPRNITLDPDFLDQNDEEWRFQSLTSPALGDLLVPQGRSDIAFQLWRYVLADQDAVDFLNGVKDPYGMAVNPWYSTDSTINPTGTAFSVPRDNIPKADPVEQAGSTVLNGPGPVNLVTWRPYTNDFEQGAFQTLRGDGQILGDWDPYSLPAKYGKSSRNLPGSLKVLSVTTTAAAERYQVVSAALLNPAGEFVVPSSESMTAAAAAMTPTITQPKVLEFDPGSATAAAAPTAYPLTMPVYAAVNPLQTDAALRADYAAFIRYAVGAGQVVGSYTGQLPAGYASLPSSWVAQAESAAQAIENGISPIQPVAAATTAVEPVSAATVAAIPAAEAVAASAEQVAAGPAVTGEAAGPLLGAATPDDPPTGPAGFALPAGLLSGLAAAGAVPMISRIRRKP